MSLNTVIIIPSRIGSTRLKNEPLVDISGKSLIHRVYENALLCTPNVFVATDSDIIKNHIQPITSNVIITDKHHISGTDRVFEAAKKLNLDKDTLIINLQGDEPFMPKEVVKGLIESFKMNTSSIVTAAHKIVNREIIANPNCVKAIIDDQSFAKDFVRNIEYVDGASYYQHIGIYGYSMATLQKLVSLKPTLNEIERKLEQLRFLDNGYKIKISKFNINIPPGIDTEDDVKTAIKYINNES